MAATTTTTILILFITTLITNPSLTQSTLYTGAPVTASSCSKLILHMQDCLSYILAGSITNKPEGTCCLGLETVLKTDGQCLCEALDNSLRLGVLLNLNRVFALPSACHLNVPFPNNCVCGNNFGTPAAPVQAPAAAPEPMAVAPTPAS